jgi:hypothetical protein
VLRAKAMVALGTQARNLSHVRKLMPKRAAFLLGNWLVISILGLLVNDARGFVLIASSPMLGEIRPLLSGEASKVLRSCVTSDLTRYQGAELKQRVDHALRLPD